jgi:uncharacterized SAM-binding protein YcdF (DUF218 family)/glycosyltransferase involved in cell wall biosynthesis
MSLVNQNFIIFSSVDWSTHWQLHHQLATSLVSSGNRVLFIENTGIRSANFHDVGRIRERIVNWGKGTHGFFYVNKGLTVYSPMLLPFPYSKLSLFINKRMLKRSISRWIRVSKFFDPIVISFLPTPLIQSAIEHLDPKLSIYYCANNMANSSISASKVAPYETVFFRSVDIVFTAAYAIQDRATKLSKKAFYFPPGIDFDKFDNALKSKDDIPADLDKISRPVIGYIGALGKVFDQDLICTLADKHPEFSIVLVGPEYTNISKLRERENIILLGARPHDQIPYYIKGFDVAIVPYICNKFTEGVYPSKLNEYLSMGIPAVTTNIKEIIELKSDYEEAIVIADSSDEFIEAVEFSVRENDQSLRELRINIAKDNSWKSRFDGISKIIEKAIKEENLKDRGWREKLSSYYDHFYTKSYRLMFLILFGYALIFHTPLMWYASQPLQVSSLPKKSDVIVVFGGYGELGLENLGFLDRVSDAVDLYKKGYATNIILSSGVTHTIDETHVMRAILLDSGIPGRSIIMDQGASSTYRSVIQTDEILKKHGWDSVLLITAPYHTRRSVMSWRKNATDIDVASVILDDKSKEVQWGITVRKIRIMIYEYFALAHNWLLNRI